MFFALTASIKVHFLLQIDKTIKLPLPVYKFNNIYFSHPHKTVNAIARMVIGMRSS